MIATLHQRRLWHRLQAAFTVSRDRETLATLPVVTEAFLNAPPLHARESVVARQPEQNSRNLRRQEQLHPQQQQQQRQQRQEPQFPDTDNELVRGFDSGLDLTAYGPPSLNESELEPNVAAVNPRIEENHHHHHHHPRQHQDLHAHQQRRSAQDHVGSGQPSAQLQASAHPQGMHHPQAPQSHTLGEPLYPNASRQSRRAPSTTSSVGAGRQQRRQQRHRQRERQMSTGSNSSGSGSSGNDDCAGSSSKH